MLRAYTILPVTAAAGLIAGAETATFLAAALAAAAAAWLAKRFQPAEHGFANLDPHKPDATIILEALRQAVDHALQTGRAVSLRVAALPPGARPNSRLSLTREGDVQLDGLRRPACLQRPGAWLPNHPLPLLLTPARSLTLIFKPCGPGRIAVSLPSVAAGRPLHWALAALLAAAACALDSGWLLAATLGFTFHYYLLEQQKSRASDDPEVQRR